MTLQSYMPRPLTEIEQEEVMTRVDMNRRLLIVERERDELRQINMKLRDRLLAIAATCKPCGGTGCVEDVVEHALYGPQVQTIECESCLDIRELLA